MKRNCFSLWLFLCFSLLTSVNPIKAQIENAPCNQEGDTDFISANFDGLQVSTSGGPWYNKNNVLVGGSDFASGVGYNLFVGSLRVTDTNDTYPAGTYAGFEIDLVNIGLLNINDIKVRLFNDGAFVDEVTDFSALFLDLDGRFKVGLVAPEEFDAIEIYYGATLPLLFPTIHVYNAFITRFCENDNVACNEFSNISREEFGAYITPEHTGVSGLGINAITGKDKLITSNPNDFANLTNLIGVAGSAYVAVKDGATTFPEGSFAGFEIQNIDVLGLEIFQYFEVVTYLDGVEQESKTGNTLLIELSLFDFSRRNVGFVTALPFDEIQIRRNQPIGTNIGTTRVYNAVVKKPCEGPDLACNEKTKINTPEYPVSIDIQNTGVSGLGCTGCQVTDAGNVIDEDESNFAAIAMPGGIGISGSVSVKKALSPWDAGTFAGFEIRNPTIATATLAQALTIETRLNGQIQESSTDFNLFSAGSSFVNGANNTILGFETTEPYNEVTIRVTRVGSLDLGITQVYNLIIQGFCPAALDCNDFVSASAPEYPVFINAENTGINSAACGACALSGTEAVIDGDKDTYAELQISSGALASGTVSVKIGGLGDENVMPAGSYAGFDVENLSLLNADFISLMTITTYLNGVQQESINGQGLWFSAGSDLVGETGRATVGIVSQLSFDEVKIDFFNTATADIGVTRIYDFELARACPATIDCNASFYWSRPDFPVVLNAQRTGVQGAACGGAVVYEPDNIINGETADFSRIQIPAGVICTGSLSLVDIASTYPAGTFAGYTIDDQYFPVQSDILEFITVRTYLDGVLQESRTSFDLVDITLLIPFWGTGTRNIGFYTSQPFDEIEIEVASLGSAINIVDVYGAFIDTRSSYSGNDGSLNCDIDTDGDGIPNQQDLDDDNDGILDTVEGEEDTDGDGILDSLDLDSDNDGIPDAVEAGGVDENGDGVIDDFVDSNGDGLTDSLDSTTGLEELDTDGDGIPNSQDLDSDNDGISDVVEAGGVDLDNDGRLDGFVDTDEDGYSDVVDGDVGNDGTAENTSGSLIPTGSDTDGDGRADSYPNANADADGYPNPYDLDSDNDGILDTVEAGVPDADQNGIVDGVVSDGSDSNGWSPVVDGTEGGTQVIPTDTDGDGYPNYLDIDADNDGIVDNIEAQPTEGYVAPLGVDSDGDGIDDAYDNSGVFGGDANNGVSPVNTDGADTPDYIDTDSDNDGESDAIEGWDTDGDGTPDTVGGTEDVDGDGLLDGFDADTNSPDPTNGTTPESYPDTENVNTPERDWREVLDTDGDGIPDVDDIDDDNDGIPDVVELATAPANGDTDGDGIPDNLDLDSDNDGILDIDEAANSGDSDLDADNDGRIDDSTDTDGDGLADGFDTNPNTADDPTTLEEGLAVTEQPVPDTDGDVTPDFQDVDSDGDGVTDLQEGGVDPSLDADNDGMIDTPTDGDGDGIVDGVTPSTELDTDGDGIPDYRDLDSDNDGLNDVDESGNPGADTDGDGIVDVPTNLTSDPVDTDGDGTPDYQDIDSDGDDTPDSIDPDVDNDPATDNPASQDPTADSDGDGVVDDTTDSDGDGIPDVTDGNPNDFGDAPRDTDGDGIPDVDDIDDDNDGIPDVVELATAPANGDSDGDGIPDNLDLDSDNDGILDIDEAANSGDSDLDADNDGRIDDPTDTDGDGLADGFDTNPNTADNPTTLEEGLSVTEQPVPDTDGDGTPDFQDVDSDGDGVTDLQEGGVDPSLDADNDGMIDTPTDGDGDGIADGVTPSTEPDTDGDGIPDYRDLDSDNDGINDVEESGNPGADADGDGIVDDPTNLTSDPVDTDGDGTPDYQDIDSDGDDTPDSIDPDVDNDPTTDNPASQDPTADSDGDGVVDDATDSDGDGIPDATDGTDGFGDTPRDTDGDGIPDVDDIDDDNDGIPDVVELATAPANGDTDGDGIPDNLDLDSDNDGILDIDEAANSGDSDLDADNDGRIDDSTDTDVDGLADGFDTNPNTADDPTTLEEGLSVTEQPVPDTDGDGTPDFQEVELASISGTVYEDIDNDDEGEEGIAGVEMKLFAGDADITTATPLATTTTSDGTDGNAVGYYEFTDLLPADYQVVEEQPLGFITVTDLDSSTDATEDDAANVSTEDDLLLASLLPGETDSGNDFIEVEIQETPIPITVSGNLYYDFNRLRDNEVDGFQTFLPSGIKAVLVKVNGGTTEVVGVEDIPTIGSDAGKFSFSAFGNTTYYVILSTDDVTVGGAVPSSSSLPALYYSTGEQIKDPVVGGTTLGSDGTIDGTSREFTATAQDVTLVDFGIILQVLIVED